MMQLWHEGWEISDRSENVHASQQHLCRVACQISMRYSYLNAPRCGFDASWGQRKMIYVFVLYFCDKRLTRSALDRDSLRQYHEHVNNFMQIFENKQVTVYLYFAIDFRVQMQYFENNKVDVQLYFVIGCVPRFLRLKTVPQIFKMFPFWCHVISVRFYHRLWSLFQPSWSCGHQMPASRIDKNELCYYDIFQFEPTQQSLLEMSVSYWKMSLFKI